MKVRVKDIDFSNSYIGDTITSKLSTITSKLSQEIAEDIDRQFVLEILRVEKYSKYDGAYEIFGEEYFIIDGNSISKEDYNNHPLVKMCKENDKLVDMINI